MTWHIGFTLVGGEQVAARDLATAASALEEFAVVQQVEANSVRVVLRSEGDSESALGKCLATLWYVLDRGGIDAEVVGATLGGIDCTDAVRDLERYREALEDLETLEPLGL